MYAPSFLILALALSSLSPAPPAVDGLIVPADGSLPAQTRAELLPLPSTYAWGRGILAGRAGGEPVARAAVEASGRFHLEAQRAGVWAVVVRAPGRVPMRYSPLPLTGPSELPPVALPPDAGIEIEVRGASGEPIAAAWVWAETATPALWKDLAADGWRVGSRLGRTDEHGRINLPRARGEALEIHAVAGGSTATVTTGGEARAGLVLEPAAGERWLEVRGAAGAPLAAVLVSAGEPAWPAGLTGDDGRLHLRGQAGGEVRLLAADGRRLLAELAPPRVDSEPIARLVLPAPAALRGRVLTAADRRPLAGALIWTGQDPGSFTSTDTRGDYEIAARSGGRFWVQAHAAGFLPRAGWVQRPDEEAGRAPALALVAAVSAPGQVVDADGAPLAGAVIELSPPGAPSAFRRDRAASRATSDDRGRFELRGLHPEATYELTATRPGYRTATTAFGTAGRSDLNLVLAKSRPAFGRVVDGRERPLADVEVVLRPTGVAEPRRNDVVTARSDAAGRFQVAATPASRVDAEARKPGFAPLRVPGIPVPSGERGAADLGTLILEPGVAITGSVRDARGQPLAEARVWTAETLDSATGPAAERLRGRPPAGVSGPRGGFVLEDLVAGRETRLLIHREGYLPIRVAGVRPPTERPIAVVLEPAFTVRGRVVDEDGEPVARARVGLADRGPPPGTVGVEPRRPGRSQSARSDARGTFGFDEVAAGKAELTASAEGFLPCEPRSLEVTRDGAPREVRLVLARGAVVEGRVRNLRDEPVAEVRIRSGTAEATSDAEGRYRLGGVPLGPGALWLHHRDYPQLAREVIVEPGTNTVDLVLEDGWHVAGEVVDDAGSPLIGVRLELRRRSSRQPWRYQAVSGARGRFRVPAVAEGSYDLATVLDGFAPTEQRRAFEVAGASVDDLSVVLRRGASLGGRILGLPLEELGSVRVEAERDGQDARPGTVDVEGYYEVPHLEPGDWWIRAHADGGRRQAEARVTIAPDDRQVLADLELGGGLTLTGRVLYEGEPLAATQVTLRGLDLTAHRDVTTDHDGELRIEDLEAGRYQIDLANPRRVVTYTEDFELVSDRELVFEIRTSLLTGTVTSAATAEPLEDVLVYIRKLLGPATAEAGPLITVGTDPAGSFAVASVTPGRYRITARRDGYSPTERQLDIELDVPPEPLELALTPAEGLLLRIHPAAGELPGFASLGVFDGQGRQILSDIKPLTDTGYARFKQVPHGTWKILLTAAGAAPTWSEVTVPGPTLELTLPPAAPLTVRVPALLQSSRVATLTLTGQDGQPFFEVEPGGTLQRRWTLIGGKTTVENLPAGSWSLRVVGADGRYWAGFAVTTGDTETAVHLE